MRDHCSTLCLTWVSYFRTNVGARLTYDAAITKVEKMKNSKKEKEKDREEAEDEYMKAKSR